MPFRGSIPPAPATQSLDLRLWSIYTRKPLILRRTSVYLDSLQAPNINNLGENILKVSGQCFRLRIAGVLAGRAIGKTLCVNRSQSLIFLAEPVAAGPAGYQYRGSLQLLESEKAAVGRSLPQIRLPARSGFKRKS